MPAAPVERKCTRSMAAGTERKHLCLLPDELPVELVAEIIAIVADGPQACNPNPFWTLAASSLVSRTWSTICRPHIFHTLIISEKTLGRLSSTLKLPISANTFAQSTSGGMMILAPLSSGSRNASAGCRTCARCTSTTGLQACLWRQHHSPRGSCRCWPPRVFAK